MQAIHTLPFLCYVTACYTGTFKAILHLRQQKHVFSNTLNVFRWPNELWMHRVTCSSESIIHLSRTCMIIALITDISITDPCRKFVEAPLKALFSFFKTYHPLSPLSKSRYFCEKIPSCLQLLSFLTTICL